MDDWFPPGIFTVPVEDGGEAPPPVLAPAPPAERKRVNRFEFQGKDSTVTHEVAKEIVKSELDIAVERLEQKIKEAGGFDL